MENTMAPRTTQTPAEPPVDQTPIEPPAGAQNVASDAEKVQSADAAAAAEEASPHKGKFVLYTGPRRATANADELKKRAPQLGEGTMAEILPVHWRQVGIESTRGFVWDLSNNWRIPAHLFTDAQLDYLLSTSNRFELVDAESVKVDR